MSYCYLCGNAIPEKEKSIEHIIPNAIGGKLKSDSVLCESHNNKLGSINDAKFVAIFSHITKLASVQTEREVQESFYGIHSKLNLEVKISKEKTVPKRLFFDKETLTLYAPNKKSISNYKNKLIKDGYDLKNISFVTEFDKDDIEVFSGFDNDTFRLGFAKIAANFATYKKIVSDDINLVAVNGEFKKELPVLPHIPAVTELLKGDESATDSYPFHVIALHSDQNGYLYCYIELFSKFKHYVLLTDSYTGDEIHEFYIYSIGNKTELTISQYLNLYPNYARFSVGLQLDKYYKAKQIPDYLAETRQMMQDSNAVEMLYAIDSKISNEYIEQFVDDNMTITSKF